MWFRIFCILTWVLSYTFLLYACFQYDSPLWGKLLVIAGWLIGIYGLLKETKKIIRNLSTAAKGVECYGKLVDMNISGAEINGKPELIATFAVIIPQYKEVKILSETVGTNRNKFPPDSYWKLKHHNGDINILKQINKNELPSNIIDQIESYSATNQQIN